MTILIDVSNLMYSSLYQSMKMKNDKYSNSQWSETDNSNGYSEDMLRHLIFNSIRIYRKKFFREFGEIVIACDSGTTWRKKFFHEYKKSRKISREASDIPWKEVFASFSKILLELKENFPYKVLNVPDAEADDVIAVICQSEPFEKHMIISSDKDLVQLQTNQNIHQYSHIKKEKMSDKNPEKFLLEQIICGDKIDGIPNILSDDDTYVNASKRSGTMSAKRKAFFLENKVENFDTVAKRNFLRNKKLIDLGEIPEAITHAIIEAFSISVERNNRKIIDFFMKYKMKNLLEHRSEY
jgi:5'-3' exonuclease